jgi:hypothetical protein
MHDAMSTNGSLPPPQVQPQPLPMQWIVGGATMTTGEKMVVVQILSPQGTQVYFLPPEGAVAFGEQIAEEGRKSGSGIVVPHFEPPPEMRK